MTPNRKVKSVIRKFAEFKNKKLMFELKSRNFLQDSNSKCAKVFHHIPFVRDYILLLILLCISLTIDRVWIGNLLACYTM
jgi:hypothetical protein